MGTMTITGAMIIIIAWLTLIEFDSYPESERIRIMNKIKSEPLYMFIAGLLPLGIILNTLGNFANTIAVAAIGTGIIFIQAFIIALLFWKRKRWKSVLLFSVIGLALLSYIYLYTLVN